MINRALFERKRVEAIENLEAALDFLRGLHPVLGPGDFFERQGGEFRKIYDPHGLKRRYGRQTGHIYEKGEAVLERLLLELGHPDGFNNTMAVAVSILSRSAGPIETLRKAVEVYKAAFSREDGFDLFPELGEGAAHREVNHESHVS